MTSSKAGFLTLYLGHAWLAVALIYACGHSEVAQPPVQVAPSTEASAGQAEPAEPVEGAEPDRAAHMQATFWMAVRARDSLIAGDLAGARRAATALERHDYEGALPETWKHWVKEMQKFAGNVAVSGTFPEAAQAVAQLGLACGDCHFQQKEGPDKQREQPLPWRDGPDTLGARMGRHEIGAEQLWAGLTVPSENDWRAGTVTLTRAPLSRPRADGEPIPAELAARVEEVRELARRARAATSHEERARVYGELIAGCGVCHQQAGVDTR